jgi:hypothetical protein
MKASSFGCMEAVPGSSPPPFQEKQRDKPAS